MGVNLLLMAEIHMSSLIMFIQYLRPVSYASRDKEQRLSHAPGVERHRKHQKNCWMGFFYEALVEAFASLISPSLTLCILVTRRHQKCRTNS
jgi:hypothetical protein